MTITFPCSGCGKQYKASDEIAGKQMKCKQCGAVTCVPTPRKLPPIETPGSVALSTRTKTPSSRGELSLRSTEWKNSSFTRPSAEDFICPSCRAICRVLPEWRGKTLECPTCRTRFVVPDTTRSVSPSAVGEPAELSFFNEDPVESASTFLAHDDAADSGTNLPRRAESSDWLDRVFQSSKKRKQRQHEVRQTDCPFGVLVMGVLLVGIQLVTALLAVVSMVRVIATPELWGRLAGSLIGLGIAWGYLNGHKAALRVYQFLGGIQIVGLVAAVVAAREIQPWLAIPLGLVAAVAVAIYFYNFSPWVESYFRGEPVRYSWYLASWHFFVPLSVCVVGITGGLGVAKAMQTKIELERWALRAVPEQVLLLTITNVADPGTKSQVESRILGLVGQGAEMKSEWQESRQRLKMAIAPVSDVAWFSQRIDFGAVTKVQGRTIEFAADSAAIERLVKADEERRQEQTRRDEELAAARRAEQELRHGETKKRVEEIHQKSKEDAAKREEERKERDKTFWQLASGPGWELERKPGRPGSLFTHHHLGYRITVPVFWELNNTVNNLPIVNPSEERESVFGFASSHAAASELKAIIRVETHPAEGDETPTDVLKRWEKARRGSSGYKRSGGIQEQKFGGLPCAGLPYSWLDRNSDAEFETWVARRDQRLYVFTIGANRRELSWRSTVDELHKAMESFELIEPESGDP